MCGVVLRHTEFCRQRVRCPVSCSFRAHMLGLYCIRDSRSSSPWVSVVTLASLSVLQEVFQDGNDKLILEALVNFFFMGEDCATQVGWMGVSPWQSWPRLKLAHNWRCKSRRAKTERSTDRLFPTC